MGRRTLLRAMRVRDGHVRGKLLNVGLHSMAVGVAAMAGGLVFISGGTPARSSDTGSGLGRPSLSVFGTIHPEIAQYRVPVGAQAPLVQLASLETDFTTDTAAADEQQTTAPMAPADGASFATRFNSSFTDRLSSFDERFATRTADPSPLAGPVQPPQMLAMAGPDVTLTEPGVATAESGSDVPLPPEAPKRQNIRLASLGA